MTEDTKKTRGIKNNKYYILKKKIFNKPSYNINKNKINNIINSNIVVNNNLNGYAIAGPSSIQQ